MCSASGARADGTRVIYSHLLFFYGIEFEDLLVKIIQCIGYYRRFIMRLEELQVYRSAMEIADIIWKTVQKWDYFAQDVIGKQLIRAVDSIAANLSEGYGRFHYKENKQFCYFSRGSLYECRTWLKKAHNRDLINENQYKTFEEELNKLSIKLNNYINTIGNK